MIVTKRAFVSSELMGRKQLGSEAILSNTINTNNTLILTFLIFKAAR